MALEQKLSVRMSQRLVMTPSLQQAIKLLQMSKLELVEEVQQELLENPVLEESPAETATPAEVAESEADAEAEAERTTEPDPFGEIDYASYFQDVEGSYSPRAARETGEELPSFENTLAKPTNLADHLTWQLELSPIDDRAKGIGRAIIGNINEDGYLRATIEEIRRLGDWSAEEVEAALRQVQGLDPAGVGARDLVECLCLQLQFLGEEGTAAETIVRCHLDKLQNRRYKELGEALGLELDDLKAELEIVRALDPRPGQKYNVQSSPYVVPDVYVVKLDDEYQVMLNEEGLPRLRISPVYRRMVARGGQESTPAEAREYVRNKLRSAFRLIKSLEERQRTIYKVATAIVKFQREFLDQGIELLRPLVLKDVADDIGMHESTVSRVVNNKYMHTHRGLFEMRFFFHSGIASSHGGASVSSLSVKERIRKIITGEDVGRPLSDSDIVKILRGEGLQIARRTVAKYREELKIPSSSSRRQVFG
ncbi:MAG TPA: RNA polymerase factor sigma-54 [Candidatus Polarisedimenticolaceae bacterium]|nr:RNA polymerase factor sigma-54 [Candidatus Polarisedimenticolaceae bacterium]